MRSASRKQCKAVCSNAGDARPRPLARWSSIPGVPRVQALDNSRPIIILPGFGNNTTDYTAPFGIEDEALTTHLKARGFNPYVLPLERKDWFKVARNLLTLGFWSSSLTTSPGYSWYLDRLADLVTDVRKETGAEQVDLVGHSAGGWLARAFLADPKYMDGGSDDALCHNPVVRSLVTLGTPHMPPPAGSKARDMTGGALSWVHRTYPGAFFASRGVRYVCVAGSSMVGSKTAEPRSPPRYAHDSYQQVAGEGEGVHGDCVVPVSCALLPGATNIVLDGVFHSMSRIGTFDERGQPLWYGSDAVVDHWLHHLVEDVQQEQVQQQEEVDVGVAAGVADA